MRPVLSVLSITDTQSDNVAALVSERGASLVHARFWKSSIRLNSLKNRACSSAFFYFFRIAIGIGFALPKVQRSI